MFETIPPPAERLLVFARLPELGKVKTRLAAGIGEERALAVYQAMLRDLIAGIGSSTSEMEIEFLWPPTPAAYGTALRAAFAHHNVAMQTGATLGDRLSIAFSERFFLHGTQKIIAIGVDDPTLDRTLIEHAFALLESCEYVIGPAVDGGYYLIGCRALSFNLAIFRSIAWGTASVFNTTMEKIAALDRTVAVLPERYDIDTVEDLKRYARERHGGELADLLRK